MAMNPLPPQAYTKETMVKAYAWLQSQSSSIKELATTPDVLVSLYLKAKLNGDASLERPSIQNFKTELKNLAGMMGDLGFSSEENQKLSNNLTHPTNGPHSFQNQQPQPPVQIQEPQTESPQAFSSQIIQTPTQNILNSKINDLDYKSLNMIREVKNEFNLSQDQEALRLLISMGYKKLKSLSKE